MSKNEGLLSRFRAVAVMPRRGVNVLKKRTIETYAAWLKSFWKFTGKPASQWTGTDIENFCRWMEQQKYAPKTRRQALCAVIYVFKNVLGVDPGILNLPAMPKEKKTLKIIPTREEVGRIFAGMSGMVRLMAGVMYGGGLRVSECCELRVKDVDLGALTIRVHGGKGDKDGLCLLPMRLVAALKRQIEWRAALHERDLAEGAGYVELPGRYGIKNHGAARSLEWQYLFPSAVIRAGKRWHATPQGVQKSLKKAVHVAGILKMITPHTLRHAFCTHALRAGNDAATVQELMRHDSLETTMTYAHGDAARGVSPMDAPDIVPMRMPAHHALNF
jgi:site-specific recombinase XerD